MHRVDPDAPIGILQRGGLGEDAHAALGRLVGGTVVRNANDAELRGYVDDGTAAGVQHSGNGRAGAQEHALEVHVDGAVPEFHGLLVDLERIAADPRVVHQHVETAELRDRFRHGGLPIRHLRNIQVNEATAATIVGNGRGGRCALLVQDVADDHGCALAGEEPGLGRAHPARAAADQRNLAVHSSHGFLRIRSCRASTASGPRRTPGPPAATPPKSPRPPGRLAATC